jgi:hypothetical protein
MNQDIGMMLCMAAGVLFSLLVFAVIVIQTVLQARILKEVRQIARKSAQGASS